MKILEVKNLYKSFGKVDVLKGVDFSIEKGEVISIIGSSGSGKTTLLRCLNFLEMADKGLIIHNGEVLLDIESQKKNSASEIRKMQLKFGLVFQDFNLFPQFNTIENITLAPKLLAKERPDYKSNKKAIYNEIEKNAETILESVGLSDKILNYPCELSGGQKQRVAIARALALNPEILYFDEPTSALDPELTGEVLKVIKSLKSHDRTMVIVTHEMEFAKNVSDKIIYMQDGIIEEIGTPEQIFNNPKSEKTRTFLNQSYNSY
ncbi:MAG: amino acid ABC transporter ATP-binding protein [Eubacteriales bacterium]|nr:amino acid ABC transporter ATP-binding protein [Eubacteriales bacterium]